MVIRMISLRRIDVKIGKNTKRVVRVYSGCGIVDEKQRIEV